MSKSRTPTILLVVDDDEDSRLVFSSILKSTGYQVLSCGTGNEALEILAAGPVHGVILDLMMPGMSGLALLEAVRKTHSPLVLPVIVMTGHGANEGGFLLQAFQLGANDYLTKTIEYEAVVARINSHMELQKAAEELDAARKQADEANVAKGDFLTCMSHEIRSPMNAILGMADILGETTLDPDQREYLRILKRSGLSLLTLINGILDLSRIEAGALDLQTVEFDPLSVVELALELMAVHGQQKGLALYSRVEPGLPACLTGDPTRLGQVLINLLTNAIKFTDAGHVGVQVRSMLGDAGRVRLRFCVEDSGIGIHPSMQAKIFERFEQVGESLSRRSGGSGLGLSISRALVDAMGGRIGVTSKPGVGSEFHFELEFAVPATPRSPRQTRDLRGKRVLLVMDQCETSETLEEILQFWGAVVLHAGTTGLACSLREEALSHGEPLHATLIDCSLPGGAALPLARDFVRGSGGVSRTVLLVTAEERLNVLSRSSPVETPFLLKPVRRDWLAEVLCGDSLDAASLASPPSILVPSAPGRPLSILLADDAEDNCTMMRIYLQDSHANLDVARNGKDACEMVLRGHYDLILMDIQMPVMDGLQATRMIRKWEQETGQVPVRILALSAQAFAIEQKRSRLAGCDEHLTKPISKSDLWSAIARNARKSPRSADLAAVVVPVEKFSRVTDSLLEERIPIYLDRRVQDVVDLRSALSEGNFTRMEEIGHRIRGAGHFFGFPRISELGLSIELSARDADRDTAGRAIEELYDLVDTAQSASRSRVQEGAS